jgi:hypothetical protein
MRGGRGGVILVLLVTWSRLALADAPRRVHVVGAEAGCPRPDEVAARLRPMVSGVAVVDLDDPTTLVVRVVDDGQTYRVIVGDTVRELSDPAQRCSDRADAAAVSIALLLAPPPPTTSVTPSLPAVLPPATQPPPTRASHEDRPISRRPPERTNIDVAASGEIDGSGSSGPAFGGGLRLSVTRFHLGASLGVAATSPVSLSLSTGGVSLTRVPIDLSFRGGYRWGRFELSGELGFVALLEVARGESVSRPVSRTDADFGLRVAIEARGWMTRRIAVFGGLQATAVPAPLEIAFHDEGIVGKTPSYWLGGAIGLAFRAR